MYEPGRADRLPDPLADLCAARCIDLRQQHGKLFTAIARSEVAGAPDLSRDDSRDGAQARVASRMAVFVVIGLEVIDIDHQQPDARAIAIGPRPLFAQPLVEAAAVGKPREAVLDRERLEPAFQVLLLGNIARDRDHAIDLAGDL